MSSEPAAARKQETGTGRIFFWCICILFLVSLPARTIRLNDSVWMDEAWVANSLMEPRWLDTFFYPGWTQSTPPLFLAVERCIGEVFGFREIVLRVFPDLASIAGSFIVAAALRRRLSTAAALIVFALLCCNYNLIKYSEQVKQYGCDFLVSAVILGLVGKYLESRKAGDLALLAGTSAVCFFLAYTADFWFPSLMLVCLLPADRGASMGPGSVDWKRAIPGVLAIGAAFAVAYVFFAAPNHTKALTENWRASLLSLRKPWTSVRGLAEVSGNLMISWPSSLFVISGFGMGALTMLTSILGIKLAWKNEEKGWWIVLGGMLPIASAIGASCLGIYPILTFPRTSIFLLPSLMLLIGFAIDEFMRLVGRELNWKFAMGIGILAAVGAEGAFAAHRPVIEQNREAMTMLQKRVKDPDVLFVDGGMFEQFKYYRALLAYNHPIYLGNEHWPCCATGDTKQVTTPGIKGFEADLQEAAKRASGQHLWLFLPAGNPQHWSSTFVEVSGATFLGDLNGIEGAVAADGCRLEEKIVFSATLVENYRCGS